MEGPANGIALRVCLQMPTINTAPQQKSSDKSTQTVRCRVRLLTPTTTTTEAVTVPAAVKPITAQSSAETAQSSAETAQSSAETASAGVKPITTNTAAQTAPSVAPSWVNDRMRQVYEDRLIHKWFFSPGRLSEEETKDLKILVMNNKKYKDVIKDLVQDL